MPLLAKPVPEIFACEMVRVAPPGLRTVTVCVLVTPTATLPKPMVPGTTEICDWTAEAVREIAVGEPEALLTMAMLPEKEPTTVDLKATPSVALWPAARVSGRVTPLVEKPAPEAVI